VASSSTSPAPKAIFSLETPSAIALNSAESYIRGWFVPNDGNTYELWLIVDNTRIRVFTGLPRPDVLRHHKYDRAFKNSGFLVRFNRSKLEASVTLIAVAKNTEIILGNDISVPDYQEGKHGFHESETEMLSRMSSFSYRPLISVLLAAPDAHPYLITRSVESVLQQHYCEWQLCVACESSGSSSSRGYLERVAAKNTRLRLVIAETGRVPELCDRALEIAEGDFVLRLDHRDELHPFALIEIVSSLNTEGAADLVYADEDEMDFYGSRGHPFLKPDFDPEAFSSWNFIGNIAAMRRSILLGAGGYKAGTDGFDDWDTMSRVLGIAGPSGVRHIPRPLYHFRKGDDLTAPLPRETNHGSVQTTSNRFDKTGTKVSIEPGFFPGSFRLRYGKGSDPRVAVLVRSEDGMFQHAALAANIDLRTTQVYELLGSGIDLLVDNRSPRVAKATQRTIRSLGEMPEDVFVFINRPLDTVSHFFFEELAAQAMRDDCGLATGISLDSRGRVLHSGLRQTAADDMVDAFAGIHFSQGEMSGYLYVVRSVDSISDAFFAVKRAQLVALGGLTTIFSTRMPQLVDRLSKLARSRGTRLVVTPYAIATFDLAGVSADSAQSHRSDSYLRSLEDGALDVEKPMPPEDPLAKGPELKSASDDAISQIRELRDELDAAKIERNLAAAQLREIATERNRLRRELAATEEPIASAETSQRVEDLQRQMQGLNTALEAERRVLAAIRSSRSWKLTSPFRACSRLIRG
jgi:glycosyltransferase involved in cell wall biosynthesis